MRLHRELGITRKSAWFMQHCLRETAKSGQPLFSGPVEVDEIYADGKEAGKHSSKKLRADHDTVGEAAVVGPLNRETGQVVAGSVENADKETPQGFVMDHTAAGATMYTDEVRAYTELPFDHEIVQDSVSEFVNAWHTPTASRAFGHCSSGAITASTTRCHPSVLDCTLPSLWAGTTSGR